MRTLYSFIDGKLNYVLYHDNLDRTMFLHFTKKYSCLQISEDLFRGSVLFVLQQISNGGSRSVGE